MITFVPVRSIVARNFGKKISPLLDERQAANFILDLRGRCKTPRLYLKFFCFIRWYGPKQVEKGNPIRLYLQDHLMPSSTDPYFLSLIMMTGGLIVLLLRSLVLA